MARRTTRSTARSCALASLAAVAGTLLSACVTDDSPRVAVVAAPDPVSVSGRFSDTGLDTGQTIQGGVASETRRPPRGSGVPRRSVADDAPDVYTVVKGDTLWDISGRFLKEPWLWPQIWDYNPQIENPHLIYPGDRMALEYIDGRATLVLSRNGERLGGDYTRVSPRIRSESLDAAIPMIPGDAIRQFLVHPQVVSLETLEAAPYVIGNFDDRLISAVGHQIYARGNLPREQTSYGVFRRNKALRDPETDELLGYEVHHVADAKLLNRGDPATLGITRNRMETIAGDLLMPMHIDRINHAYVPRLPAVSGDARIVSLVNAISQSGRDQVVVLNLGARSGIKVGDVLAVEARGRDVIDPRGRNGREKVQLPNIRTGVVMVFQSFDKVSYALVMESTRPVTVNDVVTGI